MKEEGKIRTIGVSNMTLEHVKEANAHGDIHELQLEYSMLNRSVERPACFRIFQHKFIRGQFFIPEEPPPYLYKWAWYVDGIKLGEK
ncbi:hypothetical protein BP422_09740 [Brevibacillus formosus]|uniref:NADP-dependent oxidoreductase domain-containing protein n=1 Tax=Brevibacillus formosus TaxID=54913 RepID=A0A220MFG2_9BACL|nr:hypothetical protein BP422_09740 [Brevibacillus formosus]